MNLHKIRQLYLDFINECMKVYWLNEKCIITKKRKYAKVFESRRDYHCELTNYKCCNTWVWDFNRKVNNFQFMSQTHRRMIILISEILLFYSAWCFISVHTLLLHFLTTSGQTKCRARCNSGTTIHPVNEKTENYNTKVTMKRYANHMLRSVDKQMHVYIHSLIHFLLISIT